MGVEASNEFISIKEVDGEVDDLKIDEEVNNLKKKLLESGVSTIDTDIYMSEISMLLSDFNNSAENGKEVDGDTIDGDDLDTSINGKLVEINGLIEEFINSEEKVNRSLSQELQNILGINELKFIPKVHDSSGYTNISKFWGRLGFRTTIENFKVNDATSIAQK